jgi:hypothetical protein
MSWIHAKLRARARHTVPAEDEPTAATLHAAFLAHPDWDVVYRTHAGEVLGPDLGIPGPTRSAGLLAILRVGFPVAVSRIAFYRRHHVSLYAAWVRAHRGASTILSQEH